MDMLKTVKANIAAYNKALKASNNAKKEATKAKKLEELKIAEMNLIKCFAEGIEYVKSNAQGEVDARENNEIEVVESKVTEKSAPQSDEIKSYDEFKAVALEVYNQINYDYNCRDLVPIYRIRRTIGAKVSRRQFNDYLLEMQGDEIFQLKEGSVEDSALDKIEDSVSTELDGLRCFASLL